MRRRRVADELTVVGTIRKSSTELVEVRRQRLNGIEQIYLPVFSIGGGGKVEKGICLTVDTWINEVVPMVLRAAEIKFPTEFPRTKTRPARNRASDHPELEEIRAAFLTHCPGCDCSELAKCPITPILAAMRERAFGKPRKPAQRRQPAIESTSDAG